ncbi:MAG TPA: pyridoxamine 5'-phosphate oxidase family protein [Bryobacteraceae bacterium]|jgi:hypothetical protein
MASVETHSTIHRHPERSVPDQAAQILAEGLVAHVGFVDGDRPFVIPLGYYFDPAAPDRMYFHGSPESRAVRIMASGAPLSIGVTLLDGLVYSKTALYHSMNYRSVVCFGRGFEVTDHDVQRIIYDRMVARYFKGRTAGRDYSAPTEAHLNATTLVEVQIEEFSAKTRKGGPMGPFDADANAPGTCGVAQLP